MTTMNDTKQIFIREAAELLNRRPPTIRDWERRGVLPARLRSKRNDRGWRFWTEPQIEGIKAWMQKNDMRPGKGLPHYKPTAEEVAKHLEGQREPRRRDEPVAA
jgi:hypothetical protein